MNANEPVTTARGDRMALISGLLVFPVLVASADVLWSRPAGPDAGRLTTADEAASFQYHAPDDLAAWVAMEVLIPEDGDSKRWLEKAAGSAPWEDRTPHLVVTGRRPGPGGELVGYSRLEGGRDDAMRGASESAARQIAALVIWSVRDRIAKPGLFDFEDLAKLVEDEARKLIGSVRVDDFEQSVDRPYGRLYRAAVLVRAGEKSLRKLRTKLEIELERAEKRARSARAVLVWKGGIAAALTVLAALGYLVLNAITSGYFTWRLRVLSLLGLGAAYAAIVLVRV